MNNRFLLCSTIDDKTSVLLAANTLQDIDDKTTNYENEESLANNFNIRSNKIFIYDQYFKENIQVFYKNTRRELIEYFIENSPKYEREHANPDFYYNNMNNFNLRKLSNIYNKKLKEKKERKIKK